MPIKLFKYLFVIIAILTFAQPALAARQIGGAVPSVQPLQPMPANAAPNVSNNIQFKDTSHEGEFGTSSDSSAGAQEQNQNAGQNVVGQNSPSATNQTSSHFVWWALVILCLLLLGWFWYKSNKSK